MARSSITMIKSECSRLWACRTMSFTSTKAPLWSIFPFIFEQWNDHYVSNKRKTSLPEGRASELYHFLLTQIIIGQAHYALQAIDVDAGDLNIVCQQAKAHSVAVYLATIERPQDRSGMSLYGSMVYIDKNGVIQSVHRKLMPTYEERLVWSAGDGHGLTTHSLDVFTVGGLNCWENWMPLARASLYGQGENLHVAIWPGSVRNTQDIGPFLAKEGRSYSMAVSGLMAVADIPREFPLYDEIMQGLGDRDFLANGGSCLCGPNGDFIIEPQLETEGLFSAVIDLDRVREERQNFDPAGHYSRPDVTCLQVNRERQSTIKLKNTV
ncbi:MAG: nitrilase [Arenicella sp.]